MQFLILSCSFFEKHKATFFRHCRRSDSVPVPGFHHLRAEDVPEERLQVRRRLVLRARHEPRNLGHGNLEVATNREGTLHGDLSARGQVQVRGKITQLNLPEQWKSNFFPTSPFFCATKYISCLKVGFEL